jgi:hypothetical protein
LPLGGVCTTTADCCTGITCVVPAGALSGTCENLVSGGPGDGGQPPPNADLSACAEIGQSCASAGCCLGLQCNDPSNGVACTGSNRAGCICQSVVQ